MLLVVDGWIFRLYYEIVRLIHYYSKSRVYYPSYYFSGLASSRVMASDNSP